MDINSITQFLDLVTNPTKYQEFVQLLQEREDRWAALVEAHGDFTKAAQAKETAETLVEENQKIQDNIKQTQKDVKALKASLVEKEGLLTASLSSVQEQKEKLDQEIATKQKELETISIEASGVLASAFEKEKQAQAKVDEYTSLCASVAELQAKLSASVKAITGE